MFCKKIGTPKKIQYKSLYMKAFLDKKQRFNLDIPDGFNGNMCMACYSKHYQFVSAVNLLSQFKKEILLCKSKTPQI
jgi:hypothetical protein